jgi:hypothetical protein
MEAVEIFSGLLKLASIAIPGILAATAGTQTDEEAIEIMTSRAKKLVNREEDGEWAKDLAARQGRGRIPTPSEVLTLASAGSRRALARRSRRPSTAAPLRSSTRSTATSGSRRRLPTRTASTVDTALRRTRSPLS